MVKIQNTYKIRTKKHSYTQRQVKSVRYLELEQTVVILLMISVHSVHSECMSGIQMIYEYMTIQQNVVKCSRIVK